MLRDALPDEAAATREVFRKHRGAFDEVDRMIDLSLGLITQGELTITKTRDLNHVTVQLVMGLLTKLLKTTRAIERVCAGGLGQDGITLLRVQFETAVAIMWILQRSSKKRTLLFAAFPTVTGLKTLTIWKTTKGLKRLAHKDLIGRHELEIAKFAKRLRVTPPELRERLKRHWSGLRSLEEVLRKLGSNVAYQVFYRYASPFSHVADLAEHMDPNGALRIIPGDASVEKTLHTAAWQLWWAAKRINDRLGLRRDAEFKAWKPRAVVEFEGKRSSRAQRRRLAVVTD